MANEIQDRRSPDGDNVGENDRFVRSPYVWAGILITYLLLFSASGYIAFIQEPFNPAARLTEQELKLMENSVVREHFIASLKQEGEAFKARKELAGQSFNVVLGAVLGFLSASATQAIGRRRST